MAFDDRFEYWRRWQRRLHAAGWAGITWPREYGGLGLGQPERIILQEEMARAQAPEMTSTLRRNIDLAGAMLLKFGTAEQQARYLPPLLAAEGLWCFGFSEPEAGSDLPALRTKATRDGDVYRVSGQKVWTSFAQWARWCMLLCRTDPNSSRHHGLSVLIVDMQSPGITARSLRQITGESDFCEVFFDDVRVPAAAVLGSVGDGWSVAVGMLNHERLQFALTAHLETLRTAQQIFALADAAGAWQDPLARQDLAQVYTNAAIMRGFHRGVMQRLAAGESLTVESSVGKLFWAENEQFMQEAAMRLLGARGLAGEPATAASAAPGRAWQNQYLYARAATIYGGTSEIQRNLIAERILGLPR